MSSYQAAEYGSWLNTRPSEIFEDFDGKALSNVLKVFYIYLELPSDSEKYFGFVVVTRFPSLCILQNAMFATLRIICTPAQNLDGISHSNVLGAFELCLELSSDSKDQLGAFLWENPKTDLWSQIIWILRHQRNAKSEKGLFCHDKTGWRHAMFISERYFSRTALEFN